MEVLFIGILSILTCYCTVASTAIPETKAWQEAVELKKFFLDKMHETENRYEEKLEQFRNEMKQE